MTNTRPIKKLWEIYPEIKIWWTPSRDRKEYFWWWLPWVSIRDMSDNKYITETKETLSELWVKNSNVKLIKKWALLFSFKLTVWRMAFAWYDLYTNEAIACFEPNENIDLNYLYYILPYVAHQVDRTNNYWAPLLNKSVIANLKIPLPPLATQQLIVAKLDETFAQIDEAIATTQANIDKTDELTKSVLDKVFEEREWEKKSVWNIANIKSWKRLPKGFRVQDKKTEYPYIRVSDFWEDGTIDSLNIRYITKEVFDQISRYIITDQDLYISIAGTIWKTGIIPSSLNWASLTENAIRLVYKEPEKIYNNYILYFTKSSSFIEQAWLATRAVAMPKLAISRLGNIQIPLPPLAKQQEIVSYLDHVFAQSSQLKEQYHKQLVELKELKASVLQSAFEGKLV